MKFVIRGKDASSSARAGTILTDHGDISTPVFMPVGTRATVKAIHQEELTDPIGANIILGNTYHLYLRPGEEVIYEAGGLHRFMGWDKAILTDSGGYQVYSLSQQRKIKEAGVTFRSHIDGSKHEFTPERAIDIQLNLGADILMAFDECTPYPCEYTYAKNSMGLTHRWLDRCIEQMKKQDHKHGYTQVLSPIVQGSIYKDLRVISAEYIAQKNADINAIGGLSVGEPAEILYEMTDTVCSILPQDNPRYLMGVGTPENLLECIALGVDMFDCVLPSRNARHGLLYTHSGILRIKNEKWSRDFSPIDPESNAPTSRNHTKAYLRHLFQVNEFLGLQIATLNNLSFYCNLIQQAREHILRGDFVLWKNDKLKQITQNL